jgi:predicted lipoprotein with Yx(FWY)xxD motif
MKIRRALLISTVLVALAVAASAVAHETMGHAAAGTMVSTKTTTLGTILVTGTGKTLYLDVNDKAGHPACKGACLTIWPALKAGGKVTTSGHAKSADLGTIKIAGGVKQVTYDKHPLYTFASAATGTSGEGEHGFYVVSPSGSTISKASTSPSKTTTTSTTTSTGGGYGY